MTFVKRFHKKIVAIRNALFLQLLSLLLLQCSWILSRADSIKIAEAPEDEVRRMWSPIASGGYEDPSPQSLPLGRAYSAWIVPNRI